ncbi:hypothetical protein L6R53_24950 [Myxococcota bacterium]|nr:hypothetical protein [Myxococcota bacterium]
MTSRDPSRSPRRPFLLGAATCLVLAGHLPQAQAAPADSSAAGALARALQAAPSTPQVAAACAPAGQVLQGLGQVLAGMGTAGLDPGEVALVAGLSSPDAMAALGLDPEGALALTLWSPRADPVGVLTLPFGGDEAAAQALLTDLGARVEATPGDSGAWSVHSQDGSVTLARLHDGALDLAFDGQPPQSSGLPAVDVPLVQGLPATPGCAIWVAMASEDLPAPQALKGEGGIAGAAFVPFGRGGMGLLRLRPASAPPQALRRTPAAPVLGRSDEAPSLVISIGISAQDLLTDPEILQAAKLSPSHARKLLSRVNIAGGATIATFGPPQARDLVAVVPLDPAQGPVRADKVVGRIARLARKADVAVLDRGEDSLVLSVGGTPTHLVARDGRVYLGPDAERVAQVSRGEGRPWAGDDELAWASQWPIALWSGPDGPLAAGMALSMRAGIRAVDEVVEVGIQVRTDAPPGMLTALLGAALSQGGGLPVGRGARGGDGAPAATEEELERAVEGIALAQEVQRSIGGSYLELPAAPRGLAQADPRPVAWTADPAWSRLGWTPDPPETAAVFWVEVGADGQSYVVHAATDLDGDGQPARYERSSTQPMRRTSPEGVR